MAAKPLRLLHAANLQLDCPLRGTGSISDDVREVESWRRPWKRMSMR